MYPRMYGLQRAWLKKFLKSPVSQDLSRSNLVNSPKKGQNPLDSIFIIINTYCEGNRFGKVLC